jgi:hypothetical protein
MVLTSGCGLKHPARHKAYLRRLSYERINERESNSFKGMWSLTEIRGCDYSVDRRSVVYYRCILYCLQSLSKDATVNSFTAVRAAEAIVDTAIDPAA